MRSSETFALRRRPHRAALVERNRRPQEGPVRLVKAAFATRALKKRSRKRQTASVVQLLPDGFSQSGLAGMRLADNRRGRRH
jgi:hypothetical protein